MRILNAMFSTGLGGIEQSFADYCQALATCGHRVSAITQHGAAVNASLPAGIHHYPISNRGQWDPLAKRRVAVTLKNERPDVIIAHGNRAMSLMTPAKELGIPVVGVAHNYKLKHIPLCDAAFTVSEDLRMQIIDKHIFAPELCFKIPNMLHLDIASVPKSAYRQPIKIATMGRFVHKKGFHIFLEALALLKQDGIAFNASLGGEGEEKTKLTALCRSLELDDQVNFCGWVADKSSFFNEHDIFCLPSLHEPFGIVLLEAFAHRIPVVSSNSEGPSEIAENLHDCIFTDKTSASSLKDGLKLLINTPELARKLTDNACDTLQENYRSEAVAKKIEDALQDIATKYRGQQKSVATAGN
jgi:glycosyltransferase involved in cell wall biosynthesis